MKCPRCGSENICARVMTQTFKHYRVVGEQLCVEPFIEDDAGEVHQQSQLYCNDCKVWKGPMPENRVLEHMDLDELKCPVCGTDNPDHFLYMENGNRWFEVYQNEGEGLELNHNSEEYDYGDYRWGGWFECQNLECPMAFARVTFRLKKVP